MGYACSLTPDFFASYKKASHFITKECYQFFQGDARGFLARTLPPEHEGVFLSCGGNFDGDDLVLYNFEHFQRQQPNIPLEYMVYFITRSGEVLCLEGGALYECLDSCECMPSAQEIIQFAKPFEQCDGFTIDTLKNLHERLTAGDYKTPQEIYEGYVRVALGKIGTL